MKKTTSTLAIATVLSFGFALNSCTKKPEQAQPTTSSEEAKPAEDSTSSNATLDTSSNAKAQEGGLLIEDSVVGKGKEAKSGQKVTVHYTGTFTDGKKFDSSVDRGTPFTFNLGKGEVIKGWDQGIVGMKEGGKRKLTIPSDLAYGDAGAGGVIPGGATLLFDVELLKVE